MTVNTRAGAAVFAWWCVLAAGCSRPAPVQVVGAVRVSALSPSLVRLEERGAEGFEDRVTFNVVNRAWPGHPLKRSEDGGDVVLDAGAWRVRVPRDARDATGVRVEDASGAVVHTMGPADLEPRDLPAPSENVRVHVMADHPRVVPPAWGALPPPPDADAETSGWDTRNGARDVYVFIPEDGRAASVRRDFLRLTGPVPLPPLYTFGYWTSRWFRYTQDAALAEMDAFRARGIPLDLFVVDTDWRVGASHGYAVNTELFPDMAAFVKAAHARHVRLMFNDHPEPVDGPITARELAYRRDGIGSLLGMGFDVAWYDRNWDTVLGEPVPGLRKEVWGMRLYHDITQGLRPDARPLIMSNVQGITSGQRLHASDPAAHRFPVWWTGDTYADFAFLRLAVENTVNAGALSVLPYVNDDCGGHFLKDTGELYARFFQHCALSPLLRPHTTRGQSRLPWEHGAVAERVARSFARLRYRLLPTLYAAARRAHEDGTPLLRRLDLEFPAQAEAAEAVRYLLGDDVLVSPVLEPAVKDVDVPDAQLQEGGQQGARLELFAGDINTGKRVNEVRVPRLILRGWPGGDPAGLPDGLAARWTTTWTPAVTGTVSMRLVSQGHGRLFLDDVLVLDDTAGPEEPVAQVNVKAGTPVKLRVEHGPVLKRYHVRVLVGAPSTADGAVKVATWLPPGAWEDAWTGARTTGPAREEKRIPLEETGLHVRVGGLVLQVRDAPHTGAADWGHVVVDAYAGGPRGSQARVLYEDDTVSNAYLGGAFRKTLVTLEDDPGGRAAITVSPAQGTFENAPGKRSWTLRFHLHAGLGVPEVDGPPGTVVKVLQPAATWTEVAPRMGEGVPPGPMAGVVVEVAVPATDVQQPIRVALRLPVATR